jgi:hypothetical protein
VRTKRITTRFLAVAYKAFYRVFRAAAYIPMPLDAGDFSLPDRCVRMERSRATNETKCMNHKSGDDVRPMQERFGGWHRFYSGMAASLRRPAGDSAFARMLLALAAVALGHALQISNGNYHRRALVWVGICAALSFLALAIPPQKRWERASRDGLPWVLVAGIAFQLNFHLTRVSLKDGLFFGALSALCGALITWYRPNLRTNPHFILSLCLIVYLGVGIRIVQRHPDPDIDTFMVQQESVQALLHGQNPYRLTFRNMYVGNPQFQAPANLLPNGRTRYGYVYPPANLLFALPGYLLAGDVRYSSLAANALSAVLLVSAQPGIVSLLASLLLLSTPSTFYVVTWSWVDPYLTLLLAATLYCARRFPPVLPYMWGALVACKQYLLPSFPLGLLLLGSRTGWKRAAPFFAKAVLTMAVILVPFVLWDPQAVYRSAVETHILVLPRDDALSVAGFLRRHVGPMIAGGLPYFHLLVAMGLALWKAPRTAAGFASAVALAYVALFAVAPLAFCNYYFFIIGALCCAVAVSSPMESASSNVYESTATRESAGTGR